MTTKALPDIVKIGKTNTATRTRKRKTDSWTETPGICTIPRETGVRKKIVTMCLGGKEKRGRVHLFWMMQQMGD